MKYTIKTSANTCSPQHATAFIIEALWITLYSIPCLFALNTKSVCVVALEEKNDLEWQWLDIFNLFSDAFLSTYISSVTCVLYFHLNNQENFLNCPSFTHDVYIIDGFMEMSSCCLFSLKNCKNCYPKGSPTTRKAMSESFACANIRS